eukprot:2557060-Pleurochrysis_carterae.AAC.1
MSDGTGTAAHVFSGPGERAIASLTAAVREACRAKDSVAAPSAGARKAAPWRHCRTRGTRTRGPPSTRPGCYAARKIRRRHSGAARGHCAPPE